MPPSSCTTSAPPSTTVPRSQQVSRPVILSSNIAPRQLNSHVGRQTSKTQCSVLRTHALYFLQSYGTSSSPSTSSSGGPSGPPTPQGYPVRSTGPQSQPPQRPPAPGGAPPSTYSYPGQRPPMYPGMQFEPCLLFYGKKDRKSNLN